MTLLASNKIKELYEAVVLAEKVQLLLTLQDASCPNITSSFICIKNSRLLMQVELYNSRNLA